MAARRTKPATRAPSRSTRRTTKAKPAGRVVKLTGAKLQALFRRLDRHKGVGRSLAEWDRAHQPIQSATGGSMVTKSAHTRTAARNPRELRALLNAVATREMSEEALAAWIAARLRPRKR